MLTLSLLLFNFFKVFLCTILKEMLSVLCLLFVLFSLLLFFDDLLFCH